MKPSTSASSLLREGGRSPAPSTSAAAAAAAKASTLKAGLYEELLASAALGKAFVAAEQRARTSRRLHAPEMSEGDSG